MSEEAKMYTCSWCGKPTPNYREYLHPMAGILGESGYSVCDECLRGARIEREWENEQHRVGKHGPAAVPPGGGHARGQLEQPVISSAVELFRATAWRAVPDLVTGPARRALAHGRADAPRVTASQIGETERRARALERDRARALKRSRRARQ